MACKHEKREVIVCRGRVDFVRCKGCGATFNDSCECKADHQ